MLILEDKICFYNLDDTEHGNVNRFLSGLVEKALFELESSFCIQTGEDGYAVLPMTMGRISSYYYLTHLTMRMFHGDLGPQTSIQELISVLSNASEYAELPVRHNEDQINSELAKSLPLELNPHLMDSAHTKTNILLQCHFGQVQLPSTDYNTDTKSVLDQAIRICQAMLDVSADQGWLVASLGITQLIQMIVQGRWWHDSSLLTLPHVTPYHVYCFRYDSSLLTLPHVTPYHVYCFREKDSKRRLETLPEVMSVCDGRYSVLADMLGAEMDKEHLEQVYNVLCRLPQIELSFSVKGCWEGGTGQHEERSIDTSKQGGKMTDQKWLTVHGDQEYVLQAAALQDQQDEGKTVGMLTLSVLKPNFEGLCKQFGSR
ncbi:hypothetical protein DPMN_053031 [Dreissena polymorpha]|uniref:SEC63 domain-containing protein n=1 Tax=Dreissena polymorpha TaxID=45954 RepID=A0A9D4HQA7_DREPO|nr:hypothetical protein DPMN_053031 [Dreissena polymorpha]